MFAYLGCIQKKILHSRYCILLLQDTYEDRFWRPMHLLHSAAFC